MPARSGEVADTLRLMAYLAFAVVLIVLDHRGGWVNRTRQQASLLVQPLWTVAGWPGRVAGKLYEDAGTMAQLTEENRRLRTEALVNQARMARLQTVASDNARLRGLLDAAQRGRLDAQLAPILDIDLDPTSQRLVLDAGRRNGVLAGQSVIDAGGLVGQVIQVQPTHATVLLLTDPAHAVPVAVVRNGVRLVAYGRGRSDSLALESVPLSSDVKVGDVLVTSGLGGRFPPGFPVGTVTALRPDESRAFLVGDVRPAAQFDRGRDVLLLRSAPQTPPVAVPVPATHAAPASGQAATSPATGKTASNTTGTAASTRRPAAARRSRADEAPPPATNSSEPRTTPPTTPPAAEPSR
ncbi:rod shape-determining protein MreC [Montanilutibacter psychrotolerans]